MPPISARKLNTAASPPASALDQTRFRGQQSWSMNLRYSLFRELDPRFVVGQFIQFGHQREQLLIFGVSRLTFVNCAGQPCNRWRLKQTSQRQFVTERVANSPD